MKLSPRQRAEIVAIATLRNGHRSRYPRAYIAALYGCSCARISQLVAAAGLRRAGYACSFARPRNLMGKS